MTTECSTDTNMPGYSCERKENHTRHWRTQSLGLLPSQILPVRVGWHQCGIILPQTWTLQCQEGSENLVPIDFQAGADLDCPRTSPFTWALCSWHEEETKLETVEFLWRLLLTKQARDPTEEFMVVLAEQDSLPRFQPPGGQMRGGLVYTASQTKQLGDGNHLILPCWLEEEFGYTTQGRGFLSSFLTLCLSSFSPFPVLKFSSPCLFITPPLFLFQLSPLFFTSKTKCYGRMLKTDRSPLFLEPGEFLSPKIC